MDKNVMQKMLEYLGSNQSDTLKISVPEELVTLVSSLQLSGALRKVRFKEDRTPIYTELQRNFAQGYVSIKAYERELSDQAAKEVARTVSLVSRTAHQTAMWRQELVANSRDSENTSSFFLVGTPMINLDGTSKLRTWEIAVSPNTARRLGLFPGGVLMFRRFPEVNALPMKIVVSQDIGDGCVGLPVGSIAKCTFSVWGAGLITKDVPTLTGGGDLDGDCYAGTAFRKQGVH